MTRWAVDLAGIDPETDLQRDDRMEVYTGPSSAGLESWKPADVFTLHDGQYTIGSVITLSREDLLRQHQETRKVAESVEFKFGQLSSSSPLLNGDAEFSKGPDVRVFSTFTNAQGKRTAHTVQTRQAVFRGVDVVAAFIQQVIMPEERLSARYATNPRLYKLYIADEFTGEDEMVVQLDGLAHKFTCFAIQALPAAKLCLFPQRTELLATVAEDINLIVEVRPVDPQAKPAKRQVLVPADMLAESLEHTMANCLTGITVVQGSLRIKYGPVELNINEYYDFGPGCGHMDVSIANRTILSLHRFGVTEVVLQGRVLDDDTEGAQPIETEGIHIKMDAEEAQTCQQFDISRINRYGARQMRTMCVDGERLYMMRPDAAGTAGSSQGNGEKLIRDIEKVCVSPTRPKYLEIKYTRASKHENDQIECTTEYNRALLDEKLRVLQRLIREKDDEERQQKGNDTTLSRFFHRFRLGFGKS